MIDRADVANAYRLLLGRAPESEDVIQKMTRYESPEALCRAILTSHEFLRRNRFMEPPYLLDGAPLKVETKSARETELLDFVRKEWQELGASRPYWSVLSAERWLGEQGDAQQTEFLQTGERWVQRFTDALARSGVSPRWNGVCVDYGCGLGRLSIHLAKRFRTVIGCDVSASHLQLAQQLTSRVKAGDIKWRLLRSTEPPLDIEYDAWVSFIVLQHSPPPIIANVLTNWLARLNDGGVCLFQVPTYIKGYSFDTNKYLSDKKAHPEAQAQPEVHCLPQVAVFEILRANGCRLLEVREDVAVGTRATIVSNQILAVKDAGWS